jgi:hypothetical protein
MTPYKSLILCLCAALAPACASDDNDEPTGGSYLISSDVQTPDGSSTVLTLHADQPAGDIDLGLGTEIPGYASTQTFGGSVYLSNGEAFTITRFGIGPQGLEEGESLSFAALGMSYLGESEFLSAERAFVLNDAQWKVVEWNPTTMTITREFDIIEGKREEWGHELRGAFIRESDGVMFIYIAYTNERVTFVNDLIVGVLDTTTGEFDVIEDPSCPASAGFGGFFDEAGDLYLVADNFGGFTRFGDIPDPKTSCIRRIRSDARVLDESYRFLVSEATGGLESWGFYYSGNGLAYTTGVDPSKLANYPSLYEFIFAPIHEGWVLDIRAQSATKIPALPPDGVGFASFELDGELLVPRSTGTVELYDVEQVSTTVYAVDTANLTATPKFSTGGYLGNVVRIRP